MRLIIKKKFFPISKYPPNIIFFISKMNLLESLSVFDIVEYLQIPENLFLAYRAFKNEKRFLLVNFTLSLNILYFVIQECGQNNADKAFLISTALSEKKDIFITEKTFLKNIELKPSNGRILDKFLLLLKNNLPVEKEVTYTVPYYQLEFPIEKNKNISYWDFYFFEFCKLQGIEGISINFGYNVPLLEIPNKAEEIKKIIEAIVNIC